MIDGCHYKSRVEDINGGLYNLKQLMQEWASCVLHRGGFQLKLIYTVHAVAQNIV